MAKFNYRKHLSAIEAKYEPFLMQYRSFCPSMTHETRAALRGSKVMERVDGIKTAISIINYQKKRERAVEILEEQVAEPSVSRFFAQAVQLVLDDMKTDVIAEAIPLHLLLA